MEFKDIDADYQITDVIPNIDLERILRENSDNGCQYVTIVTEKQYLVFIKKRLSKRIKNTGLFKIRDIEDFGGYGFINSTTNQSISTTGNVIRSIGFVSYACESIDYYEIVEDIIRDIEASELALEKKVEAEKSFMKTVKVISA